MQATAAPLESVAGSQTARASRSHELLKSLLIIGIVAAVRHLLAVGAELSFGPGASGLGLPGPRLTPQMLRQLETAVVIRSGLIKELAVNGAVVLALAFAWALVSWREEVEREHRPRLGFGRRRPPQRLSEG